HRRQLDLIALQARGYRVRRTRAFYGQLNRFALLAAHAMHDLLARPVVHILFVDRDDRVAVAKPRAITWCAGSSREYVDVIVTLGDGDADSVDAAALLG